jgi:inward rectifier potassium channel
MANREIRSRLNGLWRGALTGSARRSRSSVRSIGENRVIADGLEQNLWNDFYHNAMVATWPRFICALAVAFFSLNLTFATLYWLGAGSIANAREGSFSDLFFFSVETTATVGYGDMHPQTFYGHVIATIQIFSALVLLAVMTGLVFSRFSRPRARLIFARNPVIMRHNGLPTLTFRVANARNSFMSEATAKLWMLGPTQTAEGKRLVGFQPMRLLKSENPMFALSWTLFHPIDADSPIHGLTEADLLASEVDFVISISGLDESSAQTVHARAIFAAQDVRPGHEFVDLFSFDEAGRRHVDYARVHDTRPTGLSMPAPG